MRMTLEDRMLGRFPPLTPQEEADVQTYYAALHGLQQSVWSDIAAEHNSQIEQLARRFGMVLDDKTQVGKNARDLPSH